MMEKSTGMEEALLQEVSFTRVRSYTMQCMVLVYSSGQTAGSFLEASTKARNVVQELTYGQTDSATLVTSRTTNATEMVS